MCTCNTYSKFYTELKTIYYLNFLFSFFNFKTLLDFRLEGAVGTLFTVTSLEADDMEIFRM